MSTFARVLVTSGGLLAIVLAASGCPGPHPVAPQPAPPPTGEVDLPAPTAPSASPPPAAEAGAVKLGAVMMTGGIGMSDAARVEAKRAFIAAFEAGKTSLRRCYGAALGRSPALAGTMDVEVVLTRDGSIYELKPGSSKLDDPQLHRCVLQALRELRYAPLVDGEYFSITPVLHFAPE